MIDLGLGDMIFDRTALKAWYERYAARPAFDKTFYEGTRLSEIFGKDTA
jgi:glutathione S-transferase